jgi:hypothetical protein
VSIRVAALSSRSLVVICAAVMHLKSPSASGSRMTIAGRTPIAVANVDIHFV